MNDEREPEPRSATGVLDAEPALPTLPATKFHPPPPRPELVEREAAIQALERGEGRAVVLLCAPAGSGKSTVVTQWMRAMGSARTFAWVTLDRADDEPGRFWTAAVGALAEAAPREVDSVLKALSCPGANLESAVLGPLVNVLVARHRPLALVLDNYESITDEECHSTLAWLIDRLPAGVQLVLTTRERPPLPLPRWRARGVLHEITFDELAFDQGDAEALLNGALRLDLEPAEVADLVKRTEGWPAGLYLAALTLERSPDPGRAAREFSGRDRGVFEYLADEVLASQRGDVRSFLIESAALDRMSGSLCDHALGRADSAVRLAELERSNLFVIPLNGHGEWFRYHDLFHDLLRGHLELERPEEAAAARERAGAWYEDHGAIAEAITCYVDAGSDRAVDMIATWHHLFFNRDRLGARVRDWLDQLGEQRVASSAPLCVARAWLAGFRANKADMERWLERAEQLGHQGPMPNGFPSLEAEAATLRAACFVDDVGQASHWARRARDLSTPESPVHPVVIAILGFVMRTAGQNEEAKAVLADALELCRGSDWLLAYTAVGGHLSQLLLDEGEIDRAEHMAVEAMAVVEATGIGVSPYVIPVRVALGRSLAIRGELDAAAAELEEALETASGWHDSALLVPVAEIALARVRRASGDAAGARELLARARATVDACTDAGAVGIWLEEAEREIGAAARRRPVDPGDELSERELEVLRLFTGSLSQREIADRLFVSTNTIKTHARAIYRKLAVSSRAEAVERARELGILPR